MQIISGWWCLLRYIDWWGGGGIRFNITLNEKKIKTVKIKPKSLGKINLNLIKFYNNF